MNVEFSPGELILLRAVLARLRSSITFNVRLTHAVNDELLRIDVLDRKLEILENSSPQSTKDMFGL